MFVCYLLYNDPLEKDKLTQSKYFKSNIVKLEYLSTSGKKNFSIFEIKGYFNYIDHKKLGSTLNTLKSLEPRISELKKFNI